MRIFILGSDGMLGHVVRAYFSDNNHQVFGTTRNLDNQFYFDVTKNLSDLSRYIESIKPDAVINCIGLLNQVAEENKSLAVLVNGYLPHYADETCRRVNSKFIHISTDCVFDGKKGEYTEVSPKDATSFYGQSKAIGEVENGRSLTLRTSIVGPDPNEKGVGLFQWFMNQTGEVSGFDKVIWTGVTTIELAKCIEKAIESNLSGLRHVVNNQKIDKFSLLQLFKTTFGKSIEIKRKSEYVSDKSLIRKTDFDFGVPSYEQMVQDMRKWVSDHKEIYPKSQGGSL